MTAKTKGEIRPLKKRELVEGLLLDPGSRARYVEVINERMIKDDVSSFYEWIVGFYQRRIEELKADLSRLETDKDIEQEQSSRSIGDETMRAQCVEILDSGCPLESKMVEFLSERGDIRDKYWDGLSVKQQGFWKVIRKRYYEWQEKQSIRRRR